MAGLAAGLVETLREIGGAVGVAAESTVLVSQASEKIGSADPAASRLIFLIRSAGRWYNRQPREGG